MKSGLVSIIIPSHSGSDKVSRAVRSVLNQTYEAVEVIVVDDNGRGTQEQLKTEAVLKEFADCPKFHYIVHEINRNGSAARNTGVKASNGEYLGFLDDDDEYLPHYVQMHMDNHEKLNDEYALTYCSCKCFRKGNAVSYMYKTYSGSVLYEVLTHQATISSSSLIIKRKVFEELGGFDESFRRHQDWEFTARVAADYKVKAIYEVGYNRNFEYRNSSKNYETAKNYRIYYIEKMMPYIERLPKKQQKDVITSNYVGVMMQLLRKGKIVKFIKEYRSFKLGFYGIPFVVKALFSYVFINKNFLTLGKRK